MFRSLVTKEPFPLLAFLRKARLNRIRKRLAFSRTLMERIGAGMKDLEEVLNSLDAGGETESGEGIPEDEFGTTGDFSDTGTDLPAPKPTPTPTKPSQSSAPKTSRRDQVLLQIFTDMEGEGTEFTVEGRPKVGDVNDRLESLGHDPTSRAEIDRVFETYLAHRPQKAKKLTDREKTLIRIFGQMEGEKSEFTADGRPQVGAVNDRLESLGQEQSSRDEIDKVFKKYLGT